MDDIVKREQLSDDLVAYLDGNGTVHLGRPGEVGRLVAFSLNEQCNLWAFLEDILE